MNTAESGLVPDKYNKTKILNTKNTTSKNIQLFLINNILLEHRIKEAGQKANAAKNIILWMEFIPQ